MSGRPWCNMKNDNTTKITIEYAPSIHDKFSLMKNLYEANIANGMLEGTQCWVLMKDIQSHLVGGCKFYLFDDFIYIDELWIHDSFQHQGYGEKLLFTIEEEAKRKKCKISQVETYDFQNAKTFYEKYGYKEESRHSLMNGKHMMYFLKKVL